MTLGPEWNVFTVEGHLTKTGRRGRCDRRRSGADICRSAPVLAGEGDAQVQTSIGVPLCSLVRLTRPHVTWSGLIPVALGGVSVFTGGGPESPCLFAALDWPLYHLKKCPFALEFRYCLPKLHSKERERERQCPGASLPSIQAGSLNWACCAKDQWPQCIWSSPSPLQGHQLQGHLSNLCLCVNLPTTSELLSLVWREKSRFPTGNEPQPMGPTNGDTPQVLGGLLPFPFHCLCLFT